MPLRHTIPNKHIINILLSTYFIITVDLQHEDKRRIKLNKKLYCQLRSKWYRITILKVFSLRVKCPLSLSIYISLSLSLNDQLQINEVKKPHCIILNKKIFTALYQWKTICLTSLIKSDIMSLLWMNILYKTCYFCHTSKHTINSSFFFKYLLMYMFPVSLSSALFSPSFSLKK